MLGPKYSTSEMASTKLIMHVNQHTEENGLMNSIDKHVLTTRAENLLSISSFSGISS